LKEPDRDPGRGGALALDLHYDYTDNVLLAGTLGRGAWPLANPFIAAQTGVRKLDRPLTGSPSVDNVVDLARIIRETERDGLRPRLTC